MSQPVHGRIEITQWRELFDEEDNLTVNVFAADDTQSNLGLIIADSDEDSSFHWDSAEAAHPEHKYLEVDACLLTDGGVMTSHDGRRFLISITEVEEQPMEILYCCQNCRKLWKLFQLNQEIPHLRDRVAPGEPMPAGECPECGALCHKEK